MKNLVVMALCAATWGACAAEDIVFDNLRFRLTIGADACAKSLVIKSTGEECLDAREGIALFSSTQHRPFNNEIKLANPNKRTTYRANRIRREGDKLVVGFAVAPYEAVVRVKEGDGYLAFTLEDFLSDNTQEKQYGGLKMDVPPVVDFRVLQLPVKNRKNFGDWLNVSWDDRAAVAVIAADPLVDIDHEDRFGFRLLNADLHKYMKLRGGTAALVAGGGRAEFLAGVQHVEEDFDLPRGVESRRNPLLNASIYWTSSATPKDIDEHIAWAKKGGFRMMLLYYPCFTRGGGYAFLGDYDFREEYPEGEKDVRRMLDKIKAAGITPGFHTLQTHIGMKSRYVTPVADPRLNLTRKFTLVRPLAADAAEAELFVAQNPVDAVMNEKARMLKFGGEVISYEAYTTTPPYKFTGVTRGAWNTTVAAHPVGEIGGILDMSEYGATSCYVDQETDLQDEIGRKIARICDQGMAFCYFDGSEGVNPPCGVNVSLAQLRVVNKFKKMPLFTEGAAKSHFGWHLQAGANAFDTFAPEVFKEKIIEYPQAEAPIMRQDFTRLDFGWWSFTLPGPKSWRGKPSIGSQPDMWEYGTSKAAAWDCPATIQMSLAALRGHARANDLMETMRRWEDVRARKLLTEEQKEKIKNPKKEFHLEPDGQGGYDLLEWEQLDVAGGKWTPVRAFLFERNGKRVVAYWHVSGKGRLELAGGVGTLEAENMKYFTTDFSAAAGRAAFAEARIVQ